MQANIKDMTSGSPLKLIVTFALPLMLGNIFQQLYTVVDTMVVGNALGVDALAALGATDWLYWMWLGQLAVQPLLMLLNTPAEILGGSSLYLRIMFLGIPVVMAYNLLATILRSLGDGRTPLFAMIVAALSNIVLDLLFVLVLRWGIAGAATATLIAQAVSGIFCLFRIRKIDFLAMNREHFILKPAMARHLLSLGSPMAAQNAIIALGGMIITSVVNGYGVAFIGGFTASNKLYGVLEIAATSYGYAMITYVGQNLGAGKLERIRKGMRYATGVALVTSLAIATVMVIFGEEIVGAFISGTPREVLEATKIGYEYLSIMSVCLPVLYILHVTRSAVQGMGNTVLPMISGIAEFLMRTVGVLLLPLLLGETGIFVAEVSAWVGADVILIPSYFITLKKISRN